MNLQKEISKNINRVKQANKNRTEKYKKDLLNKLSDDINKATDKKKAVENNAGLIARYKSAQPKQLTQMQEALQGALK